MCVDHTGTFMYTLRIDDLRVALLDKGLRIVELSRPEASDGAVNVGASTGEYWVLLDRLRPLLATQGLHIATAAQKAVLDAMAVLPEKLLRSWVDASQITRGLPQLAVAELARREAKP
jgi:hypothetical protein